MVGPFAERVRKLEGALGSRGSRLSGLGRAMADEVLASQKDAAAERGDWRKILEGREDEVPELKAHKSLMNFFYDRGDQVLRRVLLRTLRLTEGEKAHVERFFGPRYSEEASLARQLYRAVEFSEAVGVKRAAQIFRNLERMQAPIRTYEHELHGREETKKQWKETRTIRGSDMFLNPLLPFIQGSRTFKGMLNSPETARLNLKSGLYTGGLTPGEKARVASFFEKRHAAKPAQ